MRKLLLCLSLAFCAFSCKKDETTPEDLSGVWVETSQEIDTMDFEGPILFNNHPTFDLRSQVRTFNSLYNYRIDRDSIRLRSVASSFSGYYAYSYRRENATTFSVRNFFGRPTLPPTIRFRRIR
jgi:hypothetical protein